MKQKEKLLIDTTHPPNVLLIGNGLLRLAGGGCWNQLLDSLRNNEWTANDLESIPAAMRPECLYGVDVREVQRKAASVFQDGTDQKCEILTELLKLPFDAILTTNYTYEVEQALIGGTWTEAKRRSCFLALHGSPNVHHNTYFCNYVKCADGKKIPVFHVHGEWMRKHSMVLSYYSYASAVSHLIEHSRDAGNSYQEKQEAGEPIECHGWLDYFILGNVYSVGFGFDVSEFDIWWAMERKARENAEHGRVFAYIIEEKGKELPQDILLPAMKAEERRIDLVKKDFQTAYEAIVDDIRSKIGKGV